MTSAMHQDAGDSRIHTTWSLMTVALSLDYATEEMQTTYSSFKDQGMLVSPKEKAISCPGEAS